MRSLTNTPIALLRMILRHLMKLQMDLQKKTKVSTHMDTSEKLMPNNGQAVSQLEYSKDDWLLNAFKKQTCITGSTMESEFVALATAGKEAEWLKNLLLEIPLWFKPIAPISIRCDSAATLVKAYSQMYNRKSRHLGTDKSEITRKQSKTGKHGHENQKSTKRSQRIKAEARKVKPQSNPVKEKARNQLLFTRRPTFHPHGKTKGKWKLMGKEVNSRAHKYNGRVKSVKSVKSKGYLSSLKITSHVINGRSTRGVGFCAKTLSKEAQVSLKRIATLAIRVRSLSDPTAKNKDPMIG
ncbi:hypothetical protein Tco_0476280 [Tanacetum coccineum]